MQYVIQLPVSNSFCPNTTSSPSFCVVLAPSSQLTPSREPSSAEGHYLTQEVTMPSPQSTADDRVQRASPLSPGAIYGPKYYFPRLAFP